MSSPCQPGDVDVVDAFFFDVEGIPAPQGSKKGFVIKKGSRKGRVAMVEMSKKVKPWRLAVKEAAQHAAVDALWTRHSKGPVRVIIQFFVPFPKSPKWKRYGCPDRMPDIDKLARSTLDGLSDSCVIYGDDRQVVSLDLSEDYAVERPAGARISVIALAEIANPLRRK